MNRRQASRLGLSLAFVMIACMTAINTGHALQATAPTTPSTRAQFGIIQVWMDAGDHALGAWQMECEAVGAGADSVKIVGIEGGMHPQYQTPPYYDPAAMQHERVIVAALSTAQAHLLPTGRTRLATIHVQFTGERMPEFKVSNVIAADERGERFDAPITLETETRK